MSRESSALGMSSADRSGKENTYPYTVSSQPHQLNPAFLLEVRLIDCVTSRYLAGS